MLGTRRLPRRRAGRYAVTKKRGTEGRLLVPTHHSAVRRFSALLPPALALPREGRVARSPQLGMSTCERSEDRPPVPSRSSRRDRAAACVPHGSRPEQTTMKDGTSSVASRDGHPGALQFLALTQLVVICASVDAP